LRRTLAASLALVALAGCSGGSQSSSPTSTEPTVSTAPEPTTTTPAEPATLRLEELASGFDQPLYATFAPGDGDRIFVVEQPGRIRVFEHGAIRARPFLDLRDRVSCCGEQGLLSVAFHPDYATNGRVFIDYTNLDGDTRVVELRADPDTAVADPASARELLAVDQPFSNHNGGQLAFAPDGRLYVGMGDGGGAGDPNGNGQNLDAQLGKLLSRDVDASDGGWRVEAYGLRNPWRFSFDPLSGDLYVGDVGQGDREEIDALAWPQQELPNFGWNVYEGDRQYSTAALNPAGQLVAPVAVYGHDQGCSVTGGYVYRGEAIEGLDGRYFYGDYCSGLVWSFRLRDGRATTKRQEPFEVQGLTSFGLDPAGEILLVSGSGTIYRLAAG
jgi:glucose/arabinose dehydrogenase